MGSNPGLGFPKPIFSRLCWVYFHYRRPDPVVTHLGHFVYPARPHGSSSVVRVISHFLDPRGL
jgi:hypothetical protein